MYKNVIQVWANLTSGADFYGFANDFGERIMQTKFYEIDIDNICKMNTTDEMREELLKLDGVGPKVADCILLFALNRIDVFPIDVWVRRVMNDLYIHNECEEKVNKKELQKLAEEKFLGLSGIAQQYLFYWKRENGKIA